MINKTKRIIAFLLAVQMVWMNSFFVPAGVFASQQTTITTNPELDAEESEEVHKKDNKQLINYVVTESENLTTPSEQKIVISIGDESVQIERAELSLKNRDTNETYSIEAKKIDNDGILFTMEYKDESKSGIYELIDITYVIDNEKHRITMKEAGLQIVYGVNKEIDSKPDAVAVPEEEYNENIIITDSTGSTISEYSLQEALINNLETNLLSLGKKSEVVVVIDPGHGGTNPGAIHYGLYEKNLTLVIAKYFKEELETYNNVKVYLTRTSDVTLELEERAEIAKNYGADVLVSVHLDASTSSSAKGASVYYPNSNYNSEVHNEGKKIAEAISKKLVGLGLADRGVHIRNAVDDKYDDQSPADYYGIIRHSKLRGFPGLIVEHGFLSNKDDVNNFMNSEEKLKKLGVADATAIAEFYGLSKDVGNTKANVTSQTSADGTKVQLTADEIPNAKQVRFAVWSDKNGQDDLVWYQATKDQNGKFTANVPLSNHATEGNYTVHVYAQFAGLGEIGTGTTQFQVDGPKQAEVSVGKATEQGKFTIQIKGVSSQAPIELVQVPVWSKSNQSDIVWYTAKKNADGIYSVEVDLANHNYNTGNYTIHVYATDQNKIMKAIGTAVSEKVEATASVLQVNPNSTQTSYNIKLSGGTTGSSFKSVRFAVWSAKGGQDDLVWYSAKKTSDGSWSIDVPIVNHKTAGKYYVHVYGDTYDKKDVFISDTTFEVSAVSEGQIQVNNKEDTKGTFQLVVSGVNVPSGVKELEIAVWSKANQSDLVWYTAQKTSQGNYVVNVDIAKHNYNYGTYIAHAYVTDGNGIFQFTCDTTVTMKQQPVSIYATDNGKQTQFNLKTSLISFNSSISDVKFAVWSQKGGQDDIVWYLGEKGKDATWSVNVPISNHSTLGTYSVHVYARMKTGEDRFLGETEFEVEPMNKANVTVANSNAGKGTFQVVVSGVSSKSGVKSIQIPVWSKSNQSDLSWYNAVRQSNGTYVADIDIKYHNYNYGTYIADVYGTDGNNIMQYLGGVETKLNLPEAKIQATSNSQQTQFDLAAMNVPLVDGLSSVSFAVWSAKGGQDDIVWYSSSMKSDGTWNVKVPISNHKTVGLYYVHVYANLKNGQMSFLGDTTFEVEPIAKGNVKVEQVNQDNGTFRVVVEGVSVPSGIQSVRIPIWSKANQSDLIWYKGVKQSNGNYIVDVNIKDHNYNYGTYIVDVYATDGNDITQNLCNTTVAMTKPVAKVMATGNAEQTNYTLKATGIPYPGDTKLVEFAVWSTKDGQDDIVWYKGIKGNDGSWTVNVPIINHKTEGEYIVHTYSTLADGRFIAVANTSFVVKPATFGVTTLIQDVDVIEGDFSIVVTIDNASRGITKMQIPVWSKADQSDIVWYNAESLGNNKYKVRVKQKNHSNRIALYTAHVYVTDNNGITRSIGSTNYQLTALYEIMGTSDVTLDQMVKYYKSKGTYPVYYGTTDAPTIEQYCRIFIEECAVEGVRAEVAFAQAMKETGFLRFGGDVKIEQFNFAGLGATGNGVPGESFSSVRIGVRAQIQHLKAYASDQPLKQVCVDTRFKYVVRRSAQYVEWLGIYENPNTVFAADGSIVIGRGWAMAKKYGNSLVNDYIAQMLKY